MSNIQNPKEKRTVIGFLDNEEFYNRVYDRLYTVIERYLFAELDVKFTLFLTVLPRVEKIDISPFEPILNYVGIKKQRELLEKKYPKIKSKEFLNPHWTQLDENSYPLSEMSISSELFYKFKTNNSSNLEDYISPGLLKDYFEDPSRYTAYQRHEFPILEKHFDIELDRYISVPLIQFGEIDGVAHIIYEDKGHSKLYDPKTSKIIKNNIQDIIVGFSIEYEGVIMAWHLSTGSFDLNEALPISIDRVAKKYLDDDEKVQNPSFTEFWEGDANKILEILNYKSYYTTHYSYFVSRIEQHRRILTDSYTRVLRQAVITVLLDSYAHNISAHALTTLSWIYSKRSALHARKQTLYLIQKLGKTTNHFKDIDPYRGAYEQLINLESPLPLELYPIFRFLQEKGGFWSGLTRDMNPGGLTTDMFGVLWDDFAGNALYLGTIVESEDIRILHIDVTLYEAEDPDSGFIVFPKVKFEGRLATINLELWSEHKYDPDKDDCFVEVEYGGVKSKLWYDEHPELEPLSRFVQPGGAFEALKSQLRELRLYLPGGVVGKHALYNILENELRNIKHFTGAELQRAKTEGLRLHISIQNASLDKAEHEELYKIGVWLDLLTPLEICVNGKNTSKRTRYLIKRRFDSLWEDIIDEGNNFQPKLSGNNQDKVCAAMLFNNRFSSVQDGSRVWMGLLIESGRKGRDNAFYPWITPAVTSADGKKEFQIRPPGRQNDLKNNKDYFKLRRKGLELYQKSFSDTNKLGLLKKYFYVWKGQDVLSDSSLGSEWDNTARYRIIYTSNNSEIAPLRRKGILRILPFAIDAIAPNKNTISIQLDESNTLFGAYKQWLRYWLKEETIALLLKDENNNPTDLVVYNIKDPELIQFFTIIKISESAKNSIAKRLSLKDLLEKAEAQKKLRELEYAHASGSNSTTALLYRKHGIMNRYFTPFNESKDLNLKDMSADRLVEWFEMMVARICVVDNRIQHRIRLTARTPDHYKNTIQMLFCSEGNSESAESNWPAVWEDKATQNYVKDCHFLIMHLSFIESILQAKHNNYEGDIGLFVKKELEPLWSTGLPRNFILAVTSGRGRNKWWDALPKNKEYEKFIPHIIFRPIESLLSAVEGSATQKDDFELKYRFTKVLFGS